MMAYSLNKQEIKLSIHFIYRYTYICFISILFIINHSHSMYHSYIIHIHIHSWKFIYEKCCQDACLTHPVCWEHLFNITDEFAAIVLSYLHS